MATMTPDDRSDTELLLAYGRDGDEAAFEALAARHVNMIFSVSLRRSGNRPMAEEATQNVLLSLSMKARKLAVPGNSLTGWLHTATKFEVAKLQRRETRIKKREQAYAMDQMTTSTEHDDATFLRLLPLLDMAIDQLRASDREVIVRRYLEGQDFRRIGEALGISEDTAQKRTSRAFECLNRFFRRKAGVTVSAATIASGISRHCAEAAPAICLQIVGKAAPAGFASVITASIFTTMSIGKITAVAAGVAVIGGAIMLLDSGDKPPPETVSETSQASATPGTRPPSQAAEPTLTHGTDGKAIPQADAGPYSPDEELAKLEAMSPHPGKNEMARRLAVKHQQLLNDLTADLGLNDTQAADLKEVLDTRLNEFRASLDHAAAPGASPEQREKEMITMAGGLIRGTGLKQELTDVLSEAQLRSFDEREEKIRQSQVESLAYRELADIAPVLKLKEEQKDRVFELLQKSSSEKLKEDGDARAFMALMQNQSPGKMELTDVAEAEFLSTALDGPDALSPESPEFKKQMVEVVGAQIRKQVELLGPVLDEGQRQRYHEHLLSKSLLPMFGIELPAHSEP